MAEQPSSGKVTMDKIVSLAKRRGFVFPGSDIYGGIGSCWDYGPLGVELKNNVKRAWWNAMVQTRDDVVGLDAAILMHPKVWEASGHVAGFADPLVDCKSCRLRFRADHVWVDTSAYEQVDKAPLLSAVAPTREEAIPGIAGQLATPAHTGHPPSPRPFTEVDEEARSRVKCPLCKTVGSLTEPRMFNLMFKTFMGPVEDEASVVYLRPETAQGIFVNFTNVLTSSRKKLPFGIAQTGKSFRNEITPGNFIFRTREFEQMEMEFFVKPGADEKWFEYWTQERFNWYVNLGVRKDNLRLRAHEHDELAHYARGCADVEYLFPMGWSELEGIANRGDFDLQQHARYSGQDLSYFDEETKEHIMPCVIEPSAGVDRSLLAFLIDSYDEEPDKDGIRVVLRLHRDLAPIKVAVLPLSRNEKLRPLASEVHAMLRKRWMTQYDDAQSIGRRYRRQDEIGTPFGVTIDFESLEDNAVTVRERDSMKQIRVPISEIEGTLAKKLGGEAFDVLPPGGRVVGG